MSPSIWLSTALVVLSISVARADWVSLRNDEHLRGIDFRKHGKGYQFTLETGEVVFIPKEDVFHFEKSPRGEKIEFRGKKVTLRRKIETLRKEAKDVLERRSKDVEAWARAAAIAPDRFQTEETRAANRARGIRTPVGAKTPNAVGTNAVIEAVTTKKPSSGRQPDEAETPEKARGIDLGPEKSSEKSPLTRTGSAKKRSSVRPNPTTIRAGLEARDRILALENDDRVDVLLHTLRYSKLSGARKFAANELRVHKSSRVVRGLTRAALMDDYRATRHRSLASLREIGDKSTAKIFAQGLTHKRPSIRTRAANAISLFPNRAVVPQILGSIHMTWQGFGRSYMMQVTQRSYIADYELVSGGTGFAIVEVADPVIATNLEGVALDVKVRKVELTARLRALHKITGQNFGTNIPAWRNWWEKNGEE